MYFSALPFKRFYQQADVLLAHNALLLLVKTLQHLFIFYWNVVPLSAFYPSDASQNQLVRSCKLKRLASSHLHPIPALPFVMQVCHRV